MRERDSERDEVVRRIFHTISIRREREEWEKEHPGYLPGEEWMVGLTKLAEDYATFMSELKKAKKRRKPKSTSKILKKALKKGKHKK
jgi:hypothetical protein